MSKAISDCNTLTDFNNQGSLDSPLDQATV